MGHSEQQAAVLVIRAWREDGDIRARITQTPDTEQPGFEQEAAAGEDAIVAAVRAWLRAFTTR
jgi:hypothetical protein